MPLVAKARAFAYAAHEAIGQRRRYTNLPYTTHLEHVANIVTVAGGSDEMIAAAYLHDVLEDTKVTESVLRKIMPKEVCDMVVAMTDTPKQEGLNRKSRKEMDRARIALAGPEVHTIKLADLIDNSEDIVQHDPHFARVFMHEKQALLRCLTKGHPGLLETAKNIVNTYFSTRKV
jgi:(p)ppGpp synthase/HD superfamily hydrolase